MSLWAEYVREREGCEVYEDESGFVAWKLVSETHVLIKELFVLEGKRKGFKAKDFMDRVKIYAREHGAVTLFATVDLRSNGGSKALQLALFYGFKAVTGNNDTILLEMGV